MLRLMMRRALAAFVLLALSFIPPTAMAQQLSGAVRDSATRLPIAGVVITLIDSVAQPPRSVLTDGAGRYTARVSPTVTQLRVVRLGFRPVVHRISPAERTEGRVDILMNRLPALLTALQVTGRPVCPGSEDGGRAFELWVRARDGLLAAVVAREQSPAMATARSYMRLMSPDDDHVIQQRQTQSSGRTVRPFLSPDSPQRLADAGFAEDDATGRVYKAPDADVVMDESFGTTHCFGIREPDVDHPTAIGLTFAPAPGRDSLIDVAGVLWIRTDEPELQRLEFLFTGLEPAAMNVGAGGTIRFHTMPNGVAFVERWALRIPFLEATARVSLPALGAFRGARSQSSQVQSRRTATNVRVAQISEQGGVVLRAVWNDTLAWSAAMGSIRGTVREVSTSRPLVGVTVSLAGTSDATVTDSVGAFTLATLLPGRYTIEAADSVSATGEHARRASQPVTISEAVMTQVAFALPPRGVQVVTLERNVDAPTVTGGSGSLRGTIVRAGDGLPVGGADVWVTSGDRHFTTDSAGRFIGDGITAGPTVVQIRRLGYQVRRDTMTVVPGAATTRDFVVSVSATELDTVRTVSSQVSHISPALRAFENRRLSGSGYSGYFVSESELRKEGDRAIANLLPSRVSGLAAVAGGHGEALLASSRKMCAGRAIGSCSRPSCYVTLYVDGVMLYSAVRNVGTPPPDMSLYQARDFAGVEFYPSGGNAPIEYSGTDSGCGTLLLWTRER
jgi:hypothetical protein